MIHPHPAPQGKFDVYVKPFPDCEWNDNASENTGCWRKDFLPGGRLAAKAVSFKVAWARMIKHLADVGNANNDCETVVAMWNIGTEVGALWS